MCEDAAGVFFQGILINLDMCRMLSTDICRYCDGCWKMVRCCEICKVRANCRSLEVCSALSVQCCRLFYCPAMDSQTDGLKTFAEGVRVYAKISPRSSRRTCLVS